VSLRRPAFNTFAGDGHDTQPRSGDNGDDTGDENARLAWQPANETNKIYKLFD
jgi:hypothetical protein